MTLRLYDVKTNQTIHFTTYHVTVTKGIDPNAEPLLQDFFQSENGVLFLKIRPSEGSNVIYGNQEPYLNAWVADPGGNIDIQGPVFREGGMYHFHVEIFTIDNPRNLFTPDGAPKFDTYLNVGDVSTHGFQYAGANFNTTLISYFDKVTGFGFNPATKQISWSMPFYWNTTLLKSSITYLHQEIRIPKTFVNSYTADSFNATAGGFPITGRMLYVDPYSLPDTLGVHYLLNKNDLVAMSSKMPQGPGYMNFTLSPITTTALKNTTETTTDKGGVGVALVWNASRQGNATELVLSFSDSAYGGPLKADVRYDLSIANDTGFAVFQKTGLVAINGTGKQEVTFPKNGTYRVTVTVKELDRPNQTVDLTRNGTARGIVVVPEFSQAGLFIAMGALIMAMIVGKRIWSVKRSQSPVR